MGLALVGMLRISGALAAAPSPEPGAIDAVVDALVADALRANLELDIASADVAQRLAALDQARARYLPVLDLSARYSRASGGRTIDLPIGELLNPVYASLNQLTRSSAFSPAQNELIDFQRTREQQTELALTQPVYDARIAAARNAASAGYAASQAMRAALAMRIRRDMRQAYYHWLQAREQAGIYTATLELASENLRVNRSLLANGKITPDLVYRAEADRLEVEQSLLDAGNAALLARSYVNLLRNAPLQRELTEAQVADGDVARLREVLVPRLATGSSAAPSLSLDELQRAAVAQRPELRELDAEAAAAQAGEALARAAFKPQLGFALNGGLQGSDFGLSGDERYVLASLVLKFNLFAGGADQAGLSASHAALRAARAQRAAEEQQIRVQVQQALQDLDVSANSLGTAAKRVEAAAAGFRIAARKRDLGQINQAEFVDARRALTDAELNQNITRFGALGNLAELEYALGAATRTLPPESEP